MPNLSKASLMCELSGSIEEGPLGLSSCWPFLPSRPITEVEDLGMVSLGSGISRILKHIERVSQTWLLPYKKVGLDHVEVSLDHQEP